MTIFDVVESTNSRLHQASKAMELGDNGVPIMRAAWRLGLAVAYALVMAIILFTVFLPVFADFGSVNGEGSPASLQLFIFVAFGSSTLVPVTRAASQLLKEIRWQRESDRGVRRI